MTRALPMLLALTACAPLPALITDAQVRAVLALRAVVTAAPRRAKLDAHG